MGAYEKLGVEINRRGESIAEGLGISEEEAKEITSFVVDAMLRSENPLEAIEKILKKYDGNKAVLATLCAGIQLGALSLVERYGAQIMLGEAVMQGLMEAMEARRSEEEAREA